MPVASTYDVELAVHESHGVTCSGLGVGILLWISEIVAVLPSGGNWVEGVEIVEAEGMRTAASKEEELVLNVTKFHACSWCWTLANDRNLRPDKVFETEHK